MQRRTYGARAEQRGGLAHAVYVVVEESHDCAHAYGALGGGDSGHVGAYDHHFAGYYAGYTSQKDSFAVDCIGKQRRGYGDGCASVDLVEDIGERSMAGFVAYQFEGEGYHMPVDKGAHGLAVGLAVVYERQQQGSFFQEARIGRFQRRKIYNDVGRKSFGTLHYLDSAACVCGIAVVYMFGRPFFHSDAESAGDQHAGALGCERKTVFDDSARRRQADDHASLACLGAQQFFERDRCVHR